MLEVSEGFAKLVGALPYRLPIQDEERNALTQKSMAAIQSAARLAQLVRALYFKLGST